MSKLGHHKEFLVRGDDQLPLQPRECFGLEEKVHNAQKRDRKRGVTYDNGKPTVHLQDIPPNAPVHLPTQEVYDECMIVLEYAGKLFGANGVKPTQADHWDAYEEETYLIEALFFGRKETTLSLLGHFQRENTPITPQSTTAFYINNHINEEDIQRIKQYHEERLARIDNLRSNLMGIGLR